MVGFDLKAARSARQVFESTLGALDAYRWQCGAALSVLLTLVLQVFVSAADGSDRDATQTDAQPALRVIGIGRLNLTDLVQIERACLERVLELDLRDYLHDGSILKDIQTQVFDVAKALALLAVARESCGADVPGGANVGAFSPKRGSMAPISALPVRKRQQQQARAAAYESAHRVGRRPLGRAGHEQVDVTSQPFQCQVVNVEFYNDLGAAVFQAPGARTAKTFVTTAHNPQKRGFDLVPCRHGELYG